MHSVRSGLGPNYWETSKCPAAFRIPCFPRRLWLCQHRQPRSCSHYCSSVSSAACWWNCKQRTFLVVFSFSFSIKLVTPFSISLTIKRIYVENSLIEFFFVVEKILREKICHFNSEIETCCLEHTLFLVYILEYKSFKSCNWYKSLVLRSSIYFLYILAPSVSIFCEMQRLLTDRGLRDLLHLKHLQSLQHTVNPHYSMFSLFSSWLCFLKKRYWYVKAFGWKYPVIRPPLYRFAIMHLGLFLFLCCIFFCTQCKFRDNAGLVFYF